MLNTIAEGRQPVIRGVSKSLLVVLLLLGATVCVEAAAQRAPRHSGQHSGRLTREVGALQARVESAYVVANREFADELLGANVAENPIHSARSEWQARIARCQEGGCRRAILMEELHRLQFPFQPSRQRVSHIPWRTGSYRIEYRDGGGGLQILPIIDDLVLISVGTVERHADWMCNLTAYGRIRANGTADMKVVGEDVRFSLTTGRRGEIVLSPMGPEPNGHVGCPFRGTLWGAYRPHSSR
jgi:hypothetical protein